MHFKTLVSISTADEERVALDIAEQVLALTQDAEELMGTMVE